MSTKELATVLEKFSDSPWSAVLGILLIVMTVLGSYFATSDELDLIKEEVQVVNAEIAPLKTRVNTLERDFLELNEGMESSNVKIEAMREDYHKIDIALERMSGRQDITNERLEAIREIIARRDRELERAEQ